MTTHPLDARPGWMGLLARAEGDALARLLPDLPPHRFLRMPEVGAVMVQGRAGGTGAPFNLGEMTVTRCTVELEGGAVGHAHVQGRDKAHTTRAAVIDALMQGPEAQAVHDAVLAPLAEAERATRKRRAEKVAATRVEFFTLQRGED